MSKLNSKGFGAVEALIIVIVIAALGVTGYFVLHSKNNDKKNTQNNTASVHDTSKQLQSEGTDKQSSSESLGQSSDNVSRKNDAATILAAVSDYQSNNLGALPTSLQKGAAEATIEFCGKSCDGDGSAKLGFYSVDNVSFQTYAGTLVVPDSKTVYIVNEATCKADGTGIGAAGTARDSVVLFALESGSAVQQQCIGV
ncbi:MAG TPA: hypothetical protein VG604_04040 [Candidatus Saccharimonadales bacterium]|nr:hypothetical protein [Candidatus Saccharimonadales bacterium]